MPAYELELGEHVINLTCECCNKPVKRVWGFVSRGGWAHAVYYALLAGHKDDERRVGLTVSVGKWWEDDPATVASRRWCHMWVRLIDGKATLMVAEPAASNQYPWEGGGQSLTRDAMLASELRDEFFAVADFVNVEDPAINSYLLGEEVSIRGRGCKHEDGTIDYGGQDIPKKA